MARSSTTVSPSRHGGGAVPSTVRLALWRVRRTWGLLFITGIGMIAAVMIVCTVPLYSNVAMTAGLRAALAASPQNADIVVQSTAEQISEQMLKGTTNRLAGEFQTNLGPYLGSTHFSIETQLTPIVDSRTFKTTGDQVQIVSEPSEQAAQYATKLKGSFPQPLSSADLAGAAPGSSPPIDIALTPQEAQLLKVDVGSELTTQFAYVQIPTQRIVKNLTLRVVGIFEPAKNTSFWHQHDFQPVSRGVSSEGTHLGNIYTVLASSDALLYIFDQFSADPTTKSLVLEEPFSLYWFYRFDPSRVTINDLDEMVSGANNVQTDIANNPQFNQAPYVEHTQATLPSAILDQYSSRVPVVSVPVFSLLILIVALMLFFVSMMADLLVDRQAEAVSILRSRGASRSQVFGSFVTQSIGLGIVALIVGPLLAILLVGFIARGLLPPADQGVLSIVTDNILRSALDLRWYALATAGIAVVAMIVAINRATRSDVLALRREAARARHRPLWLRLNLDIVAAIIMVVGYGISFYMTNSGVLDAHTRLLLLSPLTLLGAVFLLIACILLFLRIFPFLLNWGARMAARNRGAAPMLALAQMARQPRQSLRMTLLLAFATAFAIFTLIFTASQAQRVLDVSQYQAGADFSGTLAHPGTLRDLPRLTDAYRSIRGVSAASLGYSASLSAGDILAIPIELRAVDADTFAAAASNVWTAQDTSQPLSALMHTLSAQRDTAIGANKVPAVIDVQAAQALHVAPGGIFTLGALGNSGTTVSFVDVAEVQHIPTVSASSGSSGSASDYVPSGGVIVDYTTYATIYTTLARQQGSNESIPLNQVWLRSGESASALASVRQALASGPLQVSGLLDRRALAEALSHEPLYLDLLGVLTVGAVTALLLALLGNLVASWLSARARLTNFAVMRALGTGPGQIAGVLTWEQSIIYTASILLGVAFGALISVLVVPTLVFTGAPASGSGSDVSNGAFFVSQSVPPIQVVFSPWLVAALAALIIICIVALGLMIRVVSQPSISQTLRLNED